MTIQPTIKPVSKAVKTTPTLPTAKPIASTLFQIANVDTGEIKFVHGDEVRGIVFTYEQEVKQRLESPTSTEL